MTELHDLDATAQAGCCVDGEVSSVELVQHHLDRIDAHAEALGAFITVTAEQALERAAEADRCSRRGDAPPFCGVPTAFKDLTATAGMRTTMGSVVMQDNVPPIDAYVVELVQRPGSSASARPTPRSSGCPPTRTTTSSARRGRRGT